MPASNRDPEAPVLTKDDASDTADLIAEFGMRNTSAPIVAAMWKRTEQALRAIARGDTLVVLKRPVAWTHGQHLVWAADYFPKIYGRDWTPLYAPTREPEQEKGK